MTSKGRILLSFVVAFLAISSGAVRACDSSDLKFMGVKHCIAFPNDSSRSTIASVLNSAVASARSSVDHQYLNSLSVLVKQGKEINVADNTVGEAWHVTICETEEECAKFVRDLQIMDVRVTSVSEFAEKVGGTFIPASDTIGFDTSRVLIHFPTPIVYRILRMDRPISKYQDAVALDLKDKVSFSPEFDKKYMPLINYFSCDKAAEPKKKLSQALRFTPIYNATVQRVNPELTFSVVVCDK